MQKDLLFKTLSERGEVEFRGFSREGYHFLNTYLRSNEVVEKKGLLKRAIEYLDPKSFFLEKGKLFMRAEIISADDHSVIGTFDTYDVYYTITISDTFSEAFYEDILQGLELTN